MLDGPRAVEVLQYIVTHRVNLDWLDVSLKFVSPLVLNFWDR